MMSVNMIKGPPGRIAAVIANAGHLVANFAQLIVDVSLGAALHLVHYHNC